MRLWAIGAVVGAAALAAGYFALRPTGGSANDAPYRSAAIDRGRITASVRATGTLTPMTTVVVGSQLSGQIVEILADYNSQVKAGQVVARLNSDQIKTRRDAAAADLQQARADLVVKRAQLERAKVARTKANSTVTDLEAQRDRTRAQLTDAKLVGWTRATAGLVTQLQRFLLVDAPLSPLRTGRQPREEDRATYTLPTRR